MDFHPNFVAEEKQCVSQSDSGEYDGFGICVLYLLVTQVNCDMTLNAGVICGL